MKYSGSFSDNKIQKHSGLRQKLRVNERFIVLQLIAIFEFRFYMILFRGLKPL